MKFITNKSSTHSANVAPLVGAWIEISVYNKPCILSAVAPLVGAWIEIISICIRA